MPRPKKQQPIVETVEIQEKSYKIVKHCFVCNFGHKVNDILTYSQVLKILRNDSMINNFVMNGNLKLL